MGEKFWIQDFETGIDRLRVHFITEQGQIKRIIVIQYEAYIDGKWQPIVRFDEAHGFFHKDVMSPSGKQRKTIEPKQEMNLALTQAIEEIKNRWQSYRQIYESEYYENR